MKTKHASLVLIVLLFFNNLTAQTIDWEKQILNSPNASINSTCIDSEGNILSIGEYSQTVDFDLGSEVFNLTSGGILDVFFMKHDSLGNFIWAKSLPGPNVGTGLIIAIDKSENIIISGQIYGSFDFDPGPGEYKLTSKGGDDIYIAKYDKSGNFVWAKSFGGNDYGDNLYDLVIDDSGSILSIGTYSKQTDFDPGLGVLSYASEGGANIFIHKLDSSGNFVWVKTFGGKLSEIGKSIALDKLGNIYATGDFRETVDFDPGLGISNLSTDDKGSIFILKLTSNGSFIWVQKLESEYWEQGISLKIDTVGNILVSGAFKGAVDFDPGSGSAYLFAVDPNKYNVFILQLNSDGRFNWVSKIPVETYDMNGFLELGPDNCIYAFGRYDNATDVDPGDGVHVINPVANSLYNTYLVKLKPNGGFLWAINSNVKNTTGTSCFIDSHNQLIFSSFITNVGAIIQRISQPYINKALIISNEKQLHIYPNPANEYITIENLPKNSSVEIKTITGESIMSISEKNNCKTICIEKLPKGIYIVKTDNNEAAWSGKFMKN